MVSLPKCLLSIVMLLSLPLLQILPAADNTAPVVTRAKFLPDDPWWVEPAPRSLLRAHIRSIDALYDFVDNSFTAGSRKTVTRLQPVHRRSINTLDEVPDSAWFTNRHGRRRMSLEELRRGTGYANPPAPEGKWRVIAAKADGVTPGFTIEDVQGRRYILKFDPPRYPEMASAADMIGSKLFYALGYNTPENYIVRFQTGQLSIDPRATTREMGGRARPFTREHLTELLREQPRDSEGRIRALASRIIPGVVLGPFRYSGTRTDDPNDLVPHEDRRDLRALRVFAAWLNHTDAKSMNTLDSLIEVNDCKYVRHYLIDFGAALGSDSFAPKDVRLGHEYFVDLKPTFQQAITLGLVVPRWARTRYPGLRSVGHFTAEDFDPDHWKPNYPNAAFSHMQPDDAFWAARQVAAFTDDDIKAIVSTGGYSDARAAEYVTCTLIRRRDAILKSYLTRILPLDHFGVIDDRLTSTDIAVTVGLASARPYSVSWSLYDNGSGNATPLDSTEDFNVPTVHLQDPERHYLVATLRYAQGSLSEQRMTTRVYFRQRGGHGWTPVGIDRAW